MRPSSTESNEDVVTDNLQRFTKPRLLRAAPRIISRSRKIVAKKRTSKEVGVVPEVVEEKPSSPGDNDANGLKNSFDAMLEDELCKGVVVQGGLMRVASVSPESAFIDVQPGTSTTREYPVVSTRYGYRSELLSQFKKYAFNTIASLGERVKLPGIADDIEAYPCFHCSDRIFLTAYGLENHTRETHPEHITEVMEEIVKITVEWQRRDAIVRRTPLPVIPNNTNLTFEACRICGRLVNVEHPTALDNHLRAHKKNDQLREHMVTVYGEEHVVRLTCLDCHLVFPDDKKLSTHKQQMHLRKRKYICKWCGTMCVSMTDLNMHKAEQHNLPILRTPYDSPPLKLRSHFVTSALGQRVSAHRKSQSDQSDTCYERVLQSSDEAPCRTSCHLCGMIMVKPALLIRHMLRVHSRNSFVATIETKGLPPFRAELERGRITWWCCEMAFGDRNALMYHRRIAHPCKLGEEIENDPDVHLQTCQMPLTPPELLLEDNTSHGVPSLSSAHSSQEPSPERYPPSELDSTTLLEHFEDEEMDDPPSVAVQTLPPIKDIKKEPQDPSATVEVEQSEPCSVPQTQDEPMYVLVPTDIDISASKEETRTLILDTGEKGQQQVTLSLEQFEQLRLHAGVNFDNLQVFFMPQEQMLSF
ncbi:hypothetical protein QR680_001219 [Steinernema hermaphroditum]|uniref:C2H2-type domain-containing protein n=1 Tax=Steinernema hermaphroditum TaxID=289476 RepID=A0AA39GY55_9BILA|nr:hypothetical protein QR680_001219 [Steinernema hermaphroditum]